MRMDNPNADEQPAAVVQNQSDLHADGGYYEFQGILYGGVESSFIIVDAAPGQGVRLHSHPYAEIFIVQAGSATYTVGTTTLEVSAGQIVIAPANVPHKFINTGTDQLKQVDIHASKQFITTWLEDV